MTPQPKSRTYLSVCSGIEAATVAWHPLGWTPLAFAELAKFPRKVLAHHYPDVPLHGDFTLLRDQPWIAGADVLVGGTPCQSFSVAGLRGGLSDSRGNLTLEFVRLANAIDDLRPAASPATILWENVPGVLSSRDNAFGALLAGLAGCDAPIVNAGGWPGAGVVAGPRRVVAWRVLDAQFFGVPQRRRRVFVLAFGGSGAWRCADALLPITEGGGRDSAPRRETGEGATGASGNGVAGTLRCRKQSLDGDVVSVFQGQASVTQRLSLSSVTAPTFGTSKVPAVTAALDCSLARQRGHQNQHIDAGAPWFVGSPLRLLTPTECERLQGFPDGWTAINGDQTPDTPRYKAIGNSMAVPVMRWIGRRIDAVRQA